MQEQQQEQGEGGDDIMKMAMQIDQGMQQLAQGIGQQIPEAGKALMEVNAAYRKVMGAAVRQLQGGGQEQQQAPSQMVDQHSQGKSQQQAY